MKNNTYNTTKNTRRSIAPVSTIASNVNSSNTSRRFIPSKTNSAQTKTVSASNIALNEEVKRLKEANILLEEKVLIFI